MTCFPGIGMGLVAPSSYLAINSYFVSRRGLAMGICQAGIGLGFIAAPYLVEAMLRSYGFRGTMLLLGGISLNSIVGAVLYQPVEWHSFRLRLHKLINKDDQNGKCLVFSKKKRKCVICHVTSRCYRRLAPFHLLAVRHVILEPTSTPCFSFPWSLHQHGRQTNSRRGSDTSATRVPAMIYRSWKLISHKWSK